MDKKSILILGVGNLLMADEGVGIHVIRELEKLPLPPSIRVLDGGTGGYELIRFFAGMEKVIIIDAVKGDIPAGTIIRLQPEDVENAISPAPLSVHQVGLTALLQGLKSMQSPPPTIILGISTLETGIYRLELSQVVAESLPGMIRMILQEVENFNHSA